MPWRQLHDALELFDQLRDANSEKLKATHGSVRLWPLCRLWPPNVDEAAQRQRQHTQHTALQG